MQKVHLTIYLYQPVDGTRLTLVNIMDILIPDRPIPYRFCKIQDSHVHRDITRTVIASGHTQGVCLSGNPRKLVNLGHAPNRYQSNETKIVANEIDLYQLRAFFPPRPEDTER